MTFPDKIASALYDIRREKNIRPDELRFGPYSLMQLKRDVAQHLIDDGLVCRDEFMGIPFVVDRRVEGCEIYYRGRALMAVAA